VPKVSEAHRVKRRQQILDGARRAFGRYGYERATVPRLEEETGLSRGAIFSYYPSKLDLFLALAEQDQARVLDVWIEAGFGAVVREVVGDPEWIGVYLEVPRMLRSDDALRERWHAFNPDRQEALAGRYRRLQAEGEVRDDLDMQSIGNFLGAVLDGISVHLGAGFPVDVDGTVELVRSALAPK
jgi:TetR/AcrR family transcriptional regulator, transcriptional repressor of aconitase